MLGLLNCKLCYILIPLVAFLFLPIYYLFFESNTASFSKNIEKKMSSKLLLFKQTMDKVYGAYQGTSGVWIPKAFEENKSRYLWTDAYGVVNYLTLYTETKEEHYLIQARTLIDTVHNTLGKTRDGLKRLGNASDQHPTLGGMRIGKPDKEGGGMNQDGQYYHYLTKWMIALNTMFKVTGDKKYQNWAVELATAVHPAFVSNLSGGQFRMFWKVSIDLTRPLVNSEGGLDPYDGYVTYRLLQQSSDDESVLKNEIVQMKSMVDVRFGRYRTHDTLDAGEALWLTHFFPDEPWAKHVYTQASNAVEQLWTEGEFSAKKHRRLAFREFGTTTGVQMHQETREQWKNRLDNLHKFWSESLYERDADITPVMFCSSLIPGWLNKHYQI